MRILYSFGLAVALVAIVALGFRGGVFAQDATPVSEGTPVVETPDDGDTATPVVTEPQALTIVVVERSTTDTVIDLGDEGDSMGDLLVFANDVYDESNTELVGSDQGSCVRTIVGTSYECTWTLTLENGQIMVQGPLSESGESTLAIVGGTGDFAGVTGEMTARALSETEIEFTYTIL